MALLGFIIERDMFSIHDLYDLPPYAATGIRTHVRELHLIQDALPTELPRLKDSKVSVNPLKAQRRFPEIHLHELQHQQVLFLPTDVFLTAQQRLTPATITLQCRV